MSDVIENFGKDEWDLFYKPDKIETHCPIYDSMKSILLVEYKCTECQNSCEVEHSVDFLRFDFPKKKRKSKIIEQELNEKGYQSPRKKRGNSLISLILPDQEIPITIPELFIEFIRQKIQNE